jgi:eukaryotic-like serine/threonine-protein kinase
LNTLDQDGAQAVQELDALQHIKLIRHPFILSTERIEIQAGEVFIVMELADKNLEDLFNECLSAGLAGIPREKLLGHLLEVAEVLDLLSQQHGLQHLDIKPRNVLLVGNHAKVADFGLVKPIDSAATQQPPRFAEVSPQYASPEAFLGKFSRHSDQYSLAIVYQKMLTGDLPFQGKNARQIMMQHLTASRTWNRCRQLISRWWPVPWPRIPSNAFLRAAPLFRNSRLASISRARALVRKHRRFPALPGR